LRRQLVAAQQLPDGGQPLCGDLLAGLVDLADDRGSPLDVRHPNRPNIEIVAIQQVRALRGHYDLNPLTRLSQCVEQCARGGGVDREFGLLDADEASPVVSCRRLEERG
jgi:hypothetical protein